MDLPPKTTYVMLSKIVSFHKSATIFVMIIFLIYFKNFARGPVVYTALHGIYGIIYMLKTYVTPDLSFNKMVSLGSGIVVQVVLLLYWSFGFLLCAGYGIQRPSGLRICVALLLFSFGLILMFAADAQKYWVLERKKGLITDGLYARTRNPNYLGEMMLYSAFAIITGLWYSYIVLISIWMSLFLYRIFLKEFSLMKKEGYEE